MKVRISLLIALTIIFGLLYIFADSKLYYYGESTHNIFKKTLPLGLKPDFWSSDVSYPIVGFTITNKYGISILGKDVTYNIGLDTMKVEKVIKYGFNDTTLVAFIMGKNKSNYHVKFASDSHGKLISKVLNEQDPEDIDVSNWITLNDSNRVKKLRAGIVISYILLLVLIPIGSYINRK